jgi:hypothetical protein
MSLLIKVAVFFKQKFCHVPTSLFCCFYSFLAQIRKVFQLTKQTKLSFERRRHKLLAWTWQTEEKQPSY